MSAPRREETRLNVIERQSDGYAPPMRTIRNVLRLMKKKGFRADWDCVGVLESGALCFALLSDPNQCELVAFKFLGQEWRFVTEREFLAMPKDVEVPR